MSFNLDYGRAVEHLNNKSSLKEDYMKLQSLAEGLGLGELTGYNREKETEAIDRVVRHLKKAVNDTNTKYEKLKAQHFVDCDGRPYILLWQRGKLINRIKVDMHLETTSGMWSPMVWIRCLLGQKLFSRSMLEVSERIKNIEDLDFNFTRTNILYYPILRHCPYRLELTDDNFDYEGEKTVEEFIDGMNGRCRDKMRSWQEGKMFVITDEKKFKDIKLYSEFEKYKELFGWAESLKDSRDWYNLYNKSDIVGDVFVSD